MEIAGFFCLYLRTIICDIGQVFSETVTYIIIILGGEGNPMFPTPLYETLVCVPIAFSANIRTYIYKLFSRHIHSIHSLVDQSLIFLAGNSTQYYIHYFIQLSVIKTHLRILIHQDSKIYHRHVSDYQHTVLCNEPLT